VLTKRQGPSSLRWPQALIDYLVPTFRPQTTPPSVSKVEPSLLPEPEQTSADDPLMAAFLQARMQFRSRENVELQLVGGTLVGMATVSVKVVKMVAMD
jgi:hypothetical protein